MRYILNGVGPHKRRQGRGYGRGLRLGHGRGMGYGRMFLSNQPEVKSETPRIMTEKNIENSPINTQTSTKKANVNVARCVGCGICANVCNFGAISIINRIAKIDREKCTGCGECVQVCPRNAISLN
ncbi:DUF362 domain-containing protein [Caldisericum exile]|uniref:Ferredoxin n=1 Tax=Caldisericum exile (strain DSM 21853 / NBRC 104410 / AZM16c01) TaxID=511051 RepID=A0A7U6GDJ8_CALEA|nr:4Fe-4S binding protein [Caldisericum exile]BAL80411.1 putative ferredoxin [Caldisericum exile AZM16c01]